MKHITKYVLGILVVSVSLFFIFTALGPWFTQSLYQSHADEIQTVATSTAPVAKAPDAAKVHVATHIDTPSAVKALYMTSWVAGTPSLRKNVVNAIDTTEANSIVIDIKDYTGKVSFKVDDADLAKLGISDNRIPDVDAFIDELHAKNIYVIGRLAAFQDPYMVKLHPEWAVKTKEGTIWKDFKGISWIDAGSQDMWKYLVALAKESHNRGFDEINFDYIRFPSDGNMKDIAYTYSSTTPKATVMKHFYEYLHQELGGVVKISGDLFGMTTVANDDMGIGQMLVDALANFDYVAPMVYPSHFPATWNGYKNPAEVPYNIVHDSMASAVARAKMASTSPLKLRPWLQDFNLGAVYTAAMVKAQIQATYDVGLTSWMIWDPNNKYTSTKGALNPQ